MYASYIIPTYCTFCYFIIIVKHGNSLQEFGYISIDTYISFINDMNTFVLSLSLLSDTTSYRYFVLPCRRIWIVHKQKFNVNINQIIIKKAIWFHFYISETFRLVNSPIKLLGLHILIIAYDNQNAVAYDLQRDLLFYFYYSQIMKT